MNSYSAWHQSHLNNSIHINIIYPGDTQSLGTNLSKKCPFFVGSKMIKVFSTEVMVILYYSYTVIILRCDFQHFGTLIFLSRPALMWVKSFVTAQWIVCCLWECHQSHPWCLSYSYSDIKIDISLRWLEGLTTKGAHMESFGHEALSCPVIQNMQHLKCYWSNLRLNKLTKFTFTFFYMQVPVIKSISNKWDKV